MMISPSRRVSSLTVTAMLVSAACLLLPGLSAAQSAVALADVNVDGSLAEFRPNIAYREVRVTVTGPGGFQIVKNFGAGETPAIDLPSSDGLYKYELRFMPIVERGERALMEEAGIAGIDLGNDAAADKRSVQRGSFSLSQGTVVPDDLTEEPSSPGGRAGGGSLIGTTNNLVVSNSDGVIRNSLCVGFDCPNSPSFGDSTILLMENNTRIKFGDTSNSPFPNNDWEIEANSNLSGGASYLGFNDCGSADNDGGCATDLVFAVESGARQSALYVESDGDVGIGTSNPVLDLHIVTGNTPSLRLDQDGSSGFAPQAWDVAGNEANFFIRDVTAGSRLPLRIRPGAPTSAIDIQATGNIGVGTAAPNTAVDIFRSGNQTTVDIGLRNGSSDWRFQNFQDIFRVTKAGTGVAELQLDGSGNLTIQGNCSQVATPGSCADYVFEPEYDLPSLKELAQFIADNRHLPNVPSTEEIRANGVNVQHFQGRLLEKIEELTLYTLEQQSRIEALTARLEAMEDRK